MTAKVKATHVIHPIGKLATMADERIRENAAVAIDKDRIVWVGGSTDLEMNVDTTQAKSTDARDCLVTPGLIDSHTHFVFGGGRQHEFVMRLQGKSYQEIASQGGGIQSTVTSTRAASRDELLDSGRKRLDEFLRQGVTTVEGKSGYDLSLEGECRTLEVMQTLGSEHAIDVVTTFLGAHAVPADMKQDRQGYLDQVVQEMLPAVKERQLATFCDVFCDEGAFSVEESRYVLEAAKNLGFKLKIHTDEFASIGGAELAAELGAKSADHLCALNDRGVTALAQGGVVATLLPGTNFFLNMTHAAPAKKLLDAGATLAIATDFNPGSNASQNLLLTGTIACLRHGLTPMQVLRAMTQGAATALDLAGEIGTIAVGKKADLVLFDAMDVDYLFYHYGKNHCRQVIKSGKPISAS